LNESSKESFCETSFDQARLGRGILLKNTLFITAFKMTNEFLNRQLVEMKISEIEELIL
jgi:hypothetical protein